MRIESSYRKVHLKCTLWNDSAKVQLTVFQFLRCIGVFFQKLFLYIFERLLWLNEYINYFRTYHHLINYKTKNMILFLKWMPFQCKSMGKKISKLLNEFIVYVSQNICGQTSLYFKHFVIIWKTSMHSSRMRTTRLFPRGCLLPGWGVSQHALRQTPPW